MSHQFECPVCEQRFAISKKSADKKVVCPGCSYKFELPAAKTKPKHSQPSPLAASAPLPKAIPLAKTIVPEVDHKAEDLTQVRPNKASRTVYAAAKKKRKKQERIRGIAIIIGLALVVGILSGLLVMRLLTQNKKATADNVTAVEPTAENSSIAGSDSNEEIESAAPSVASKKKADSKPAKPQLRHEDLTPQKFFFHDSDKVGQCWDLVHPHLVKLTVHDGTGSHKAIGTIVDSRGWILTSYSAIKGASRIDVTSGYKTIDQSYQPPKLADTVRGIIASDPQQDIAILSINRRFIESFANIVVTEKNFVVEGEFMLQCAPPTEDNVYGSYESKIAISGEFDDLSSSSQSLAEKRNLTSPTLRWLVCEDKQKAVPGSPLVRINGTLEAIHVFSVDNKAHYVPVHRLKNLLAGADEKPQPLSVLPDSTAGDSQTTGVAVDHPARETNIMLNRSVELCKNFNWIATSKTEYEQLREFSGNFATTIKYIQDNQKSDPELTEELQAQVKQIMESISAAVNKHNLATLGSVNQFAANDLKQPKPNQVIPLFGRVAQLEVSVGNDVLQLAGTPTFVALNPDEKRDPFFRGDFCMAFIQIPETPSRKGFKIGGLTVQSTLVDLITRIDR